MFSKKAVIIPFLFFFCFFFPKKSFAASILDLLIEEVYLGPDGNIAGAPIVQFFGSPRNAYGAGYIVLPQIGMRSSGSINPDFNPFDAFSSEERHFSPQSWEQLKDLGFELN